jgi:fumarylacetoacetate (FAA) hydrolase
MKFATYQDGSRDGQLLVVSRDLSQAHYATGISGRLQAVLDDWGFLAPQLQDLSDALNAGRARHAFAFEAERCLAPLPRAHQWVGGGAFASHARLLHQAWPLHWAQPPQLEPQMAQGPSGDFAAPTDEVRVASEALQVDFSAELFAVTGDVRQGVSAEQALEGVRLLGLANVTRLCRLLEAEHASGWGLLQAMPSVAMAPVLVTPDELGPAWADGRAQLTLQCSWNGRKFGLCDTAAMDFGFGELLAHAAKTRRLRAGTLIGSGVISNAGAPDEQGRMAWPKGFGCLRERQAMEQVQDGQVRTGFMRFGDTVRLDLRRDGQSLLGAIEQTVMPLNATV